MHPFLNRRIQSLSVVALIASIAVAGGALAVDRIYTLVHDTPFDGSPFGFSGTITTDGSTGYFADVSFIKDWSITVHTPSDVDGIATEVFTRATGPPIHAFRSTGGGSPCLCLHVNESTISIDAPSPPFSNLVLAIGVAGTSPTSISWIGPYFTLTGRPREVQIVDVGESPEWESRMFGDLSSLPIGTDGVAIPEPCSFFLSCISLTGILASSGRERRRPNCMLKVTAVIVALVAFAARAQADIFQWEYINPADPSQGKQQSTTLAPDGAGADAVPGADLSGRNLTMAYLIGADVGLANFFGATLTDADFTDAEVRGASFGNTTQYGFTAAQLYSTASYHAHDLAGIDFSNNFSNNGLSGWCFGGQNLINAVFESAGLRAADFSRASLANARLGWADLTGAKLRSANLANVSFGYLEIEGGFIRLATLAGADLTAADARGARFFYGSHGVSNSVRTNTIQPDGHVNGLDLDAGDVLVVRDYDGNPTQPGPGFGFPTPFPILPIPITVDQHLAMGPGGTLRMVFEADAWDSTISFAPGIPVTLGGTLELTFTDDVNRASQVGRTFDLFDWTGVTPTGAFAVSSPYAWDLSNLYTTGEVTLTAIPEPSPLLLFSFCLAAMIVACRIRLGAGRQLCAWNQLIC